MQLVENAENVYWDLVQARDNLRVQERALELANEALKRAQRELELGAMSPLDIYQPQQNYATAEISVSQARYFLKQREDALRKQIGADLDPVFRLVPIALTETTDVPIDTGAIDVEAAVQNALLNRPDLKAANQALDVDDLQIKSARNSLLPDLQLLGLYSAQGRGGNFFQRQDERHSRKSGRCVQPDVRVRFSDLPIRTAVAAPHPKSRRRGRYGGRARDKEA
ncbi:MAG: hypothetical protein DMG58_27250 [Acidobacteria bacterium]|nr:MAG: hypothetical protein DMG58_27250 [Acidobacteriota bacterium]